MPHPSAYDPVVDDNHEPLDEKWETLTASEMCELLAQVRDQVIRAYQSPTPEKPAPAPYA